MKRFLAAVAVTPFALLALGWPAAAAKPDVVHETYSATYADAYWSTADSEGSVHAALTRTGPTLTVWQASWDGDTSVQTVAEVSDGFSFTIDRARLTSARLTAESVPAMRCTYDEGGEPVDDCVPTSIDVDLTWTATGQLGRGGYTDRYKRDGFSYTVNGRSTDRDASAEGSVVGETFATDTFDFASMASIKYTETKRCTEEACPSLKK